MPLAQVAALGSDEFPAFYTRSSGVRAPWRLETPAEAAAAIAASARLGLAGCVIGVPIPAEHAAEGGVVEEATQCAPCGPARRLQCRAWMLTRVRRRTALAEAAAANVGGAAVTPFILRRVSELTGGASLKANIALIKHNARVGAQIAVALAPLLAADAKRD